LIRISTHRSGVVWISPAGCQPSDRIYLCRRDDMNTLITGLGTAVLPPNREYNPHEYLHIAVNQCTLQFEYIPEMSALNPLIL